MNRDELRDERSYAGRHVEVGLIRFGGKGWLSR